MKDEEIKAEAKRLAREALGCGVIDLDEIEDWTADNAIRLTREDCAKACEEWSAQCSVYSDELSAAGYPATATAEHNRAVALGLMATTFRERGK